MEVLLDTHFPNIENPNPRQRTEHQFLESEIGTHFITEKRVKAAFNSFSPYKAPGPDGIQPILIQKGIHLLSRHLCVLYKACLSTGYNPEHWQSSRVVFLPKPGKDDYSEAKSYRPISLTSFLLKGMERLIYWYLIEEPLREVPLHKNQYAYKANTSTEDALHALVSELEKAFFNGQIAIAVFLDIEGAFNNALASSMTRGLRDHGVNSTVIRWISYMLGHRRAETSLCGSTTAKQVMKGCPQGGILSPLLWNLLIDSLLALLEAVPAIRGQAFADDVATISFGPVLETVISRQQEALDRIHQWSRDHDLRFCPRKTVAMLVTRKRLLAPRLLLGGEELQFSKQVKYLGVILDNRLCWTPHVKAMSKRAVNSLAQCRRAIGCSWGLTPRNMHWLYLTAIRPIVEYGCSVWLPAVQLRTVQNLLNKVQRAACLAITSAFPGTPTAALETFLNIPPLHIHLQAVATLGVHRMQVKNRWRGNNLLIGSMKSHVDQGSALLRNEEIYSLPVDWCERSPNLSRRFSTRIPNRSEYADHPTLDVIETEGELNCFTDGSKTDSGTGAGYIIRGKDLSEDKAIPLGTFPSVFQAEITAIDEVSSRLIHGGITNHRITIYSDSQSGILALTANFIFCKTVKSCRDRLLDLSRDNEVTIQWIPGHAGLTGNELADARAREASETPFIGPQPSICIPLQTVKRRVKEIEVAQHKTHWQSRVDCRQSKMFCPEPTKALGKDLLRLTRQELREVIQIMSGHANLARHRHLTRKANSPNCICGKGEETAFHHVARCQRYSHTRFEIFQTGNLMEDDLPRITPRELAYFCKRTQRLSSFGED